MFYVLKYEDKFCLSTKNKRSIRTKDPTKLIEYPILYPIRLEDELNLGYEIIYESKGKISKKALQKIKDRYIEYFL